ncbi:deubiquitination-protection protein [Acrasis kona]|uniref:Deubiquitination-protection protein n=1 Tax=Acrasis kona TaxID=1008807 RepID=A0AAW2ZEW7_9EUKA
MEPSSIEEMQIPRYPISSSVDNNNNQSTTTSLHMEVEPILPSQTNDYEDFKTSMKRKMKYMLAVPVFLACDAVIQTIAGTYFGTIVLLLSVIIILQAILSASILSLALSLGMLVVTCIHSMYQLVLQPLNKEFFLLLVCVLIECVMSGIVSYMLYLCRTFINLRPVVQEDQSQQSTPQSDMEVGDDVIVQTPFRVLPPISHNNYLQVSEPSPITSPSDPTDKYQSQLNVLKEMGFPNEELNIEKLVQHNGDLRLVVSDFLSTITNN